MRAILLSLLAGEARRGSDDHGEVPMSHLTAFATDDLKLVYRALHAHLMEVLGPEKMAGRVKDLIRLSRRLRAHARRTWRRLDWIGPARLYVAPTAATSSYSLRSARPICRTACRSRCSFSTRARRR